MTYNVTHPDAVEEFPSRPWAKREGTLVSAIVDNDPDILGIQEATVTTKVTPNVNPGLSLKNNPNMSAYSMYPTPTGEEGDELSDDGASAKFIFYKTDRFNLIKWGSMAFTSPWKAGDSYYQPLCEKPKQYRTARWVILEEKTGSHQRYFVLNTHLHARTECWPYRAQMVSQIHQLIADKNTDNYPIFVMGDMNTQPEACLTGPWVGPPSREEVSRAVARLDAQQTGYDLEPDRPLTLSYCAETGRTYDLGWDGSKDARLDYIFHSKNVAVTGRTIDDRKVGGNASGAYRPSDHLPVTVTFQAP